MPRLLVATRNPGKVREIAAALADAGIDGVVLEGLDSGAPEIEETGATFEANARLKAEGYSRLTDDVVLADDSGLEVDALDGEPGVRSARWGGAGLDDAARAARLLDALRDTADTCRTARFRCVLALARGGRTLATYEGVAEGAIAREARGSNGFGYDPVFVRAPDPRTFAELTREEKLAVSHRGRALRKLVAAIAGGAVELATR